MKSFRANGSVTAPSANNCIKSANSVTQAYRSINKFQLTMFEHKSPKRKVKSVPQELHQVKSDKIEEVKGGSPYIFKVAELQTDIHSVHCLFPFAYFDIQCNVNAVFITTDSNVQYICHTESENSRLKAF